MNDFREWILVKIFPDAPLYQLVSVHSSKTPLQRFGSKRQNQEAAAKLLTALDKIRHIGVGRSVEIGLVKRLQESIVEVKVPGSVIRALSYHENGQGALVVISVERTHQGSGNMHKVIEDARKKQSLIKSLLTEKKGSERWLEIMMRVLFLGLSLRKPRKRLRFSFLRNLRLKFCLRRSDRV